MNIISNQRLLSLWEMLQWPSCRITTWTRTHRLQDTIIYVCVCLCFSLLTPVQMEGLPFLFVVTNISQMSLDLCWLLTLLSPSPSPPLSPSIAPCFFLHVSLSPFLSLSFCRRSLFPLSLSLGPSHPPCLPLSPSAFSPSLPVSLSLSVVRKLQEFELPYVSISSLQSSDFHILLRKRYSPPAHITTFSSHAPSRLFVIFDHNWIISLTTRFIVCNPGTTCRLFIWMSMWPLAWCWQQLIWSSASFVQ